MLIELLYTTKTLCSLSFLQIEAIGMANLTYEAHKRNLALVSADHNLILFAKESVFGIFVERTAVMIASMI